MPPIAELDGLRVVLVSTRNPLNMGAVARAMGNFGFSHLAVVNPYEPAFREARSAVGAARILAGARTYGSLAEAVADCTLVVGTTAARKRELQQPLTPLAEGASIIRKHLASGCVALVFGSEKRGLSNHDLSYCHWLMRISTREPLPSMNLGQAVAICLYEVVRTSAKSSALATDRPARAADLERLTHLLLELLATSGYTGSESGAKVDQKVRRLIRRLALSTQDAETWLGMFRQILWKLHASESE